MDILEKEQLCYDYFIKNKVKTRFELRQMLKTNPIYGVSNQFAEIIYSNYKAEQKARKFKHNKSSQTVCISDLHIPYQDAETVNLVFDCIVDLQPENLVLNGDIIDCYWNSKFVKKPENRLFLQDEADIFYKTFSYLRKYIPKTNVYYVLGNHEDRISKNQWDNPQFFGLRALKPSELLQLDKLRIKVFDTKVIINDFIYYHGDRVTSKASYSAKAEFEDHKMKSGISGHTHRLGSYYHTYDEDTTFWFENGCLCTLNPDYIKEKVNWQQGFSIVNYYDEINQVEQILINNHKFKYNGKIYK